MEKDKNIINERNSFEFINDEDKFINDCDKKLENKKNKKSKKISILMFAVNILIVLAILIYNITQNEEFTPLSDLNFNFNFLLIIVFITLFTLFLDSFITNIFIKNSTQKSNLSLSYKAFSIMRYYDSITPMGAGGQPFMTTYLMSNNISGSKSLSIPVKKFLTQQFSWLIVTFFGLLYSLINKSIENPFILFFSILGFTINLFLDVFILIGSSSERVTKGIAIGGLNILAKLKIIKNYDIALNKTINFMKEYQLIMKEFSSNKKQIFFIILVGIFKNILYFTIPFFIFCCFSTFDFSMFFTFFAFTIIVELSASCFPLPGGSGMNEVTFSVLFSTYLPNAVFWAMLLWRFFSYYFLIFQGITIMAYDLINKKSR